MTARPDRRRLLLTALLWLPLASAMPITVDDHDPPPSQNGAAGKQAVEQNEAAFFLTGLPDLRRRLSLSPLQHAPWYTAEATSKTVLPTLWQQELPLGQWRQQLDNPEIGFAEIAGDMQAHQQRRAEQWQQFVASWETFEATLDSAQKDTLRRYWRDWTVHCQRLQNFRQQVQEEGRREDGRRPNGGPPPGGPGIRGFF